MTKQPPTDEQRLVHRFERAQDEAPLSESEAREVLGGLGIDVDGEFKRMMAALEEREEAARRQQLADADAGYRQLLAEPRKPVRRRTPTENRVRYRELQARYPDASAHHHDLTHVSDGDLASLVEQLEALEDDAEKE